MDKERRKKAYRFIKEKKYPEAEKLFAELFGKQNELPDGTQYLFCLLRNKKYRKALDISRRLYKINPSLKKIRNLYAQSIYYTQLKPENTDYTTFIKAAEAITRLSKPDDPYGFFTQTVLKVLQKLKNNKEHPELRLEWANKLKASRLNTRPYQFTDASGKTRKLPSQLETWALHKTDALYKCRKYEESIKFAEIILSKHQIKKSRYALWIKRLQALSYRKTEKLPEAEKIYSEITKQKNDWFLIKEYAEILRNSNKNKPALRQIFGIRTKQLPPYAQISVCLAAADICLSAGYENQAEQLQQSAKQIAQNRQIKLSKNLSEKLPETTRKPPENLWQKLSEKFRFAGLTKHSGTILKYLPGKKAGFIKTQKRNYFFSRSDFINNGKLPQIGETVSFYITESYDKKKQKKSLKAFGISQLKN